jgi:hypothetical protein
MKKLFWLIFVLGFFVLGTSARAQTPSSEADSDAFINANFILQDAYNGVLCVSQDGACPAEISVAVPCLAADCARTEQTYAVSQTFDTIQGAAEAAQPGNLIIITPGRYAGVNLELTGGTDGAYIHFLGWGEPGSVIIDRIADPALDWLRHNFYFIAAHHYIIQNLAFENAPDGAGIFVSGFFSETGQFAHHVIVMNVYSHDNSNWGLHTTATNYILVQDSVFTNSREEHGAYFSGSGDNMLIRRNVFQGNIASGLQVNSDPYSATEELYYWISNTSGDTCGISEDDLEFITWDEVKACYDAQGLPDLGEFIEDGISQGIIIEQNVMTANGEIGGAAINLASLRNSTVRNNIIYGNFAGGITCWDDAYAESKGLDSSPFGCANLVISNNTIVDDEGNRGGLIITNDAHDIQIFNNIIIRDRFDAYEIAFNSGNGTRGGSNYYTAQNVEESPGYAGDEGSFADISVAEGLAQFVNPNFNFWVLEGEGRVMTNPDRPDFSPLPDSVLATAGNLAYATQWDALGNSRSGTEIGALAVGVGSVAAPDRPGPQQPAAESPPAPAQTSPGLVAYSQGGQIYLLDILSGPQNLSAMMDTIAPGLDGWVNIAPDGQWLLMETERFDPECNGWACLAIGTVPFGATGVIYVDGAPLHSGNFGAVASGGGTVVYAQTDGPHSMDIFSTTRSDTGWASPVVLTSDSPYDWNDVPALSSDGARLLFECGNEPYGAAGTAICEVNIDGSGLRVVLTPDNAPAGFSPGGALTHADYAPDGSIVFEGEWNGSQIWRLPAGGTEAIPVGAAFNNDNAPCVLSDGRIVSLWLDRPGGPGLHELKIMNADGSGEQMLVQDADVVEIGCGG